MPLQFTASVSLNHFSHAVRLIGLYLWSFLFSLHISCTPFQWSIYSLLYILCGLNLQKMHHISLHFTPWNMLFPYHILVLLQKAEYVCLLYCSCNWRVVLRFGLRHCLVFPCCLQPIKKVWEPVTEKLEALSWIGDDCSGWLWLPATWGRQEQSMCLQVRAIAVS